MKKIAVLTSNKGTGTNLQAIIDACENHEIQGKVVVVVSNAAHAQGLERARKHKLPTEVFPWTPYQETNKTRAEYSKDLAAFLKEKYNPDVIAFAGWMLIVTDEFIKEFPIIFNVHPGLIPDEQDGVVQCPDGSIALSNKGEQTDNAVANFFEKHSTYAGSTIHVVTADADWGPVVTRVFEKIRPGDTVDSLYTRLKKKENKMLARAVKLFCEDKLVVKNGRVKILS